MVGYKKYTMEKWYEKYLIMYDKPFNVVPESLVEDVRHNLDRLQSNKPEVTISVIAYNEEKHLFACLWSLSEMICKYPVEIIGVDNDSKDCTSEIFEAVGIPFFKEYKHSCGHARLCGLNHANGKFHVNIDADTMYPPHYVDIMINSLKKRNVVGASSLWSYISDKQHSQIKLFFYELTRDIFLYIQAFKRPELSVRGLVFAYKVDVARKVGIRTDIIRGEDGYLAFQLKEFGRIIFVRNKEARAVTGYGTVGVDGSMFNSFKVRIINSMKVIGRIFYSKSKYEDRDDNLINKDK